MSMQQEEGTREMEPATEKTAAQRWLPLLLGGGGVLLVAIALIVVGLAQRSVARLPDYGPLPRFDLSESRGGTFSHRDLEGQLAILELMFTSCPDVCPIMDANLARLYRAFEGTDAVRLVSITVDPANDTPEALRSHAERLGVDDRRWVFLRGEPEAVRKLAVDGLKLAVSEEGPMGHSTRWTLVDGDGRIRGYYDGTDPASVKTLQGHLRKLLRDR